MIVELVGTSGCGKSTLQKMLSGRAINDSTSIVSVKEFLIGRLHAYIGDSRLSDFIVDVIILRKAFSQVSKYSELLNAVFSIWKKHRVGVLQKMRLLRSILRKLCIHELCLSPSIRGIAILIDEGVTSIPQVALTNISNDFSSEDVLELTTHLPRGHTIIHLDTDEDILFRRVTERIDPPLCNATVEELHAFIINSQSVLNTIRADKNLDATSNYHYTYIPEGNITEVILSNILKKLQ